MAEIIRELVLPHHKWHLKFAQEKCAINIKRFVPHGKQITFEFEFVVEKLLQNMWIVRINAPHLKTFCTHRKQKLEQKAHCERDFPRQKLMRALSLQNSSHNLFCEGVTHILNCFICVPPDYSAIENIWSRKMNENEEKGNTRSCFLLMS